MLFENKLRPISDSENNRTFKIVEKDKVDKLQIKIRDDVF